MSRERDLDPRVAVAAGAIANARAARRGAPRVTNILDVLPEALFAEVVEDAHAAIVAVDLHDLSVAARSASRLSPGYLDALRLDLGASTLLVLMRDRASRASGAFSGAGAGTMTLNAENADSLWRSVAGFVRTAAGQPLPPEAQEPTP